MLLVLPVRVFRMLQVPQRTTASHHGNRGEVVIGWRGAGTPLQSPGVPGIVARQLALEVGRDQVVDKNQDADGLKEHPYGDDEIPGIPAAPWLVRVNAT